MIPARDLGAEKYRIEVLRALSPEKRIRLALDLSEWTRELFRRALARRHPELSPEELRRLYLQRIERCHNRSY